jgi:hypothetical protein
MNGPIGAWLAECPLHSALAAVIVLAAVAAIGWLMLRYLDGPCCRARESEQQAQAFCHFDEGYWSGQRKSSCGEPHLRELSFCSLTWPYPGFWCVEAKLPCASMHVLHQLAFLKRPRDRIGPNAQED